MICIKRYKDMIKRDLKNVIIESAKYFPIISLTGPRQSGKTTLAKMAFPEAHYVSLESSENYSFAETDPIGFLNQFGKDQVILDEAQRVPELFSDIQCIVDENQIPGQYIITGSQNFLLLEKITQSLAGRVAIHHLLPLSLAELQCRTTLDYENITDRPELNPPQDKLNWFKQVWTGGFPRIYDKKIPADQWLANYLETYVQRDVRSIVNISDLQTYIIFMKICAGRSGQLLNIDSIANDCGIDVRTVKRWLSILETSFIITLQRPYYKNFNKRQVKSPKIQFLDSGLLCYLLGIRSPKELVNHSARGEIFESWVISEIFKSYYHTGQRPDLYFFRDSNKKEVDVILEVGQKVIPIEIKSAQTFNESLFKGLNYFNKCSQGAASQTVLIYGGDQSVKYKDHIVLPWFEV